MKQTKPYAEKLKDPRWQKKRLEVMQRDEFKCRDYGSTNKTLHVHHCFYERGDPWAADTNHLLTLCEDCHDRREEIDHDAHSALAVDYHLRPSKGMTYVLSTRTT